MDKKTLIKQIAKGNELAFRQFVLDYQDRVYNTCFGYLQNQQEAEDQAQEVFIEIFRSASSFKFNSTISTWVYRIAVNKCLDYIRYQKREKRSGPEVSFDSDQPVFVADSGLTPEGELTRSERHQILWSTIKSLAENQQTALVLSAFEGLRYQEVAEVMELTKGSVESLIFRAKQNLKKALGGRFEELY